jgi:AraC family transcriptional regulator
VVPELITPDEVPIWVPGQLTVRNPDQGWSGMSVRGYQYPGSDVEVPPVRDFVIVAYRQGHSDMRRQLDGRWSSEDVGPGDVSLLTRAADSRWVWSQDLDVLLVFLTEQEVTDTCRQMFDRDVADVDIQDVLKASDPAIHRTATLTAEEAARGEAGSQLMIDSLSCQLSVYLLRRYARIQFRDSSAGDSLSFQQTRLVRDYVQEHLHENISLQDLAGTLALSRFHFSRRFRNATGTTPHKFVLQQRVDYAQDLLRRTQSTLSEVARICGFADQSHMTRVFRQKLRITPAQYRRESGKSTSLPTQPQRIQVPPPIADAPHLRGA